MTRLIRLAALVSLAIIGCRRSPPSLEEVGSGSASELATAVQAEASGAGDEAAPGVAKDGDSVVRAAFEEGRLPTGDGPVAASFVAGASVLAPPPVAIEHWLRGEPTAIEYVALMTAASAGERSSVVEGPGVAGSVPNVLVEAFVPAEDLSAGDLVLAPHGLMDALRPAIVVEPGDPVKVVFSGTAIMPPADVPASRVMAITPMGAGSTVACAVGTTRVAHTVLLRSGPRALVRGPGGVAFMSSLDGCGPGGVDRLPAVDESAAIAVTGGEIAVGTVRAVDAENLRVGVEVVAQGRRATHWGTRADLFAIPQQIPTSAAPPGAGQ